MTVNENWPKADEIEFAKKTASEYLVLNTRNWAARKFSFDLRKDNNKYKGGNLIRRWFCI